MKIFSEKMSQKFPKRIRNVLRMEEKEESLQFFQITFYIASLIFLCQIVYEKFFFRCEEITLQQVQNRFIFVTSYFKHSHSSYYQWLKNILHLFYGELYIFTSPNLTYLFTKCNHSNIHLRTHYHTTWDVPCTSNKKDLYQKHFEIDPERIIHKTPDLYSIWNQKICLVKEISDEFPKSMIFWFDIGSVRESLYSHIHFHNYTRLNELYPKNGDGKMIFSMVDDVFP